MKEDEEEGGFFLKKLAQYGISKRSATMLENAKFESENTGGEEVR